MKRYSSNTLLRMGNNQTISIELLDKEALHTLVNCSYTVSTSLGEETGWKIQQTPHTNQLTHDKQVCEFADQDGFASRLIPGNNNEYGFRIFLNNDSDTTLRKHDCGWYPCFPERRHIWPSHLITKEEKETWWKWIDSIFKDLKSEEELRIRRGYPRSDDCPDYPDCSGCSTRCFARPFDASGNKLY